MALKAIKHASAGGGNPKKLSLYNAKGDATSGNFGYTNYHYFGEKYLIKQIRTNVSTNIKLIAETGNTSTLGTVPANTLYDVNKVAYGICQGSDTCYVEIFL